MDYIKQCLKDAKEAIEKKDFTKALEICTDVLRYDDKNFNVFLFIGLSNYNLDRYPASEKGYLSASKLNPSSPFPLRGLIDLYTKTSEYEKLVMTINDIIPLISDASKKKEMYIKLLQYYSNPNLVLTNVPNRYSDGINIINKFVLPEIKQEEVDQLWKLYDQLENFTYLDYSQRFKTATEEIMKSKNIPIINPAKAHVIGAPTHTPEQKIEKEKIDNQVDSELLQSLNLELYKDILFNHTGVQEYVDKNIHTNESIRIVLERMYSNYIQFLFKLRNCCSNTEEVGQEIYRCCIDMKSRCDNPCFALETLICLYEENGSLVDDKQLTEVSQVLHNKHNNKGLGWIGVGYCAVYLNKEYGNESKAMLEKGLNSTPESILGFKGLAKWYQESNNGGALDRVVTAVAKGLQVAQTKTSRMGDIYSDISLSLQMILVETYTSSCENEKATKLLLSLLEKSPNNPQILFELAKLYFDTKNYQQAKQHLSKLENIDDQAYKQLAHIYLGWIAVVDSDGDINSALSMIQTTMSSQETALGLYVLGLVYKKMDKKTEATQSFLKSAKLNPNYSSTFSQLASLYRGVDNERSKKCYQKAISLDILNQDAGLSLADIYVEAGQISLAVSLYKEITTHCLANRKQFPVNVVLCSWAFYRLALYQMDNSQLEDSANCFLNAIKGDSNNAAYWRGLGEAYRRQTKYIASLKALKKAEEIVCSSSAAPELHFQIASLDYTMGLYQDAVYEFEQVLKSIPHHVPTLKGLAQCQLDLAKDHHKAKSFNQAATCLMAAEKSIKMALDDQKSFDSCWKLLGDISTFYIYLPSTSPDYSFNALEKLVQGSEAYIQCVKIRSNAASLYDLSLNYYYQTLYLLNKDQQEQQDNASKLSIKCITQALNIEPNDARLWNAMGVVLMDRYPLQSQHAFIKSIQLDSSKPQPYNNLALLYLQHGFVDQANSALMIAKSNNPDSVVSWSIQGLIHEIKSLYGVEYLEMAKNDYHHIAIALESTPVGEALLGYGISCFMNQQYDIAYSILYKFIELYPTSIDGHNYLSLVYENQRSYPEAIQHLHRAIQLVSNQKDKKSICKQYTNQTSSSIGSLFVSNQTTANLTPSLGESNLIELSYQDKLKLLSINLSRCQYLNGQYKESLETIKPFGDVSTANVFGNSLLLEITGLNHYHLGNIDQAIDFIKKSISIMDNLSKQEEMNTDRKLDLSLLLAKLMYRKKAADIKSIDALIIPILLSKNKNNQEKLWFFLASIYIIAKDYNKAIDVLGKAEESGVLSSQLFFLKSSVYIIQGKQDVARRHLLKSVHMYPHDPLTWTKLAQTEMNFPSDPSPLPNSLMGHASIAKENSNDIINDNSIYETLARSQLSRVASPYLVSLNQSISSLKRIVHTNPTLYMPWYYLQNALYYKSIYSNDIQDYQATQSCYNIVMSKHLTDATKYPTTVQAFEFSQSLIHLKLSATLDQPNFIALFDKLLVQHKDCLENKVELLLIKAKHYQDVSQYKQAIQVYKEALACSQSTLSIYHNLSFIYEKMNNFEASLLCLNQCLSLITHNDQETGDDSQIGIYSTTIAKIARIHILQRKFRDASKLVDSALSKQSKQPNSTLLLIKAISILHQSKPTSNNVKQFTNDMVQCNQLLSDSISSNSKLTLAHYYKSITLLNLKQYKSVSQLLQEELLISPHLEKDTQNVFEKLKVSLSQQQQQ
ncbi:hypothetical protein CYY_006061 [Polysphondylium violaceum]|uniref:Tetratricopeptide-like helical domain-containing protein n=1 Tax=Polysphondylium violaceum TaxID=133409 RepID=A0A8J4PRX6_9MYCE|nr:hypothetical protein CYY_006061 [Polysphondylium violaceum]